MAKKKRSLTGGGRIPAARRVTKMASDLGIRAEVDTARESYRQQDLTAAEASARVYLEKRIGERWQAWRERKSQAEILNGGVPMTALELSQVKPGTDLERVTSGATIGDEVLSFEEEVRWAMQTSARVRNGDAEPTDYPNPATAYWFGVSRDRPRDFDRMVIRMETPKSDGSEVWMRDGEQQFQDIERQLREVRREVRGDLLTYEPELGELFRESEELGEVS